MESKTLKLIILLCGILLFQGVSYALDLKENIIRVAVVKDELSIDLSITGKYQIFVPKSNTLLKEGRTLRRTRVQIVRDGIIIGNDLLAVKSIQIVPHKDTVLYLGEKERRYRENIEIHIDKNGKLLVLNVLDIEHYVKGVLYHEVSDKWPIQAMMAQAVAVRSYALYQIQTREKELFDVTSDIYSQVYGGKSAERYRTNIAARRTKGEFLTYHGKVLPAYFHSNCGGHTEDVQELWNHKLAPLKGGVCPFCVTAPNYRWKKNFQSSRVQEALNKSGYKIGMIKSIEIISRTGSGRIKDLKIIDREGKSLTIPGKKFREAVGPNELKSNFYDIEMKGYFFDVHGKGWGHGVGMCQWGANGMAHERKGYKEILEFYYPGTEISGK